LCKETINKALYVGTIIKETNLMRRYYLVGLVIFLTSFCTPGNKEQNPTTEATELNEAIFGNSKQKELTDRGIILVEQKKLTIFSDSKERDEFLIYVTGETIYKGTVCFQITNHKGVVIHKESFSSKFLIGYDFNGDQNSKTEMEEFIVERIKNFFDEEYFLFPAISAKDGFDEDYSDKDIWEDILSDQTAIGFYYLIGEGDGRRIAYSKKKGKVVMYHNCC